MHGKKIIDRTLPLTEKFPLPLLGFLIFCRGLLSHNTFFLSTSTSVIYYYFLFPPTTSASVGK